MRNLLIAVLAVLVLAGCANKPTLVTEEKRIVVEPPEGLWQCPGVPEPPVGQYTQAEVADYILQLYTAHQVCEKSIKEVREFLENAKLITKQVEN